MFIVLGSVFVPTPAAFGASTLGFLATDAPPLLPVVLTPTVLFIGGTVFFDVVVEIVGLCDGGCLEAKEADAVVTILGGMVPIFGTLAGTALRQLGPVVGGTRLYPANDDIPLTVDELVDEVEDAFAFMAISQAERLRRRCVLAPLVSVSGFTRSLLAIIATVVALMVTAFDVIGARFVVYFGR